MADDSDKVIQASAPAEPQSDFKEPPEHVPAEPVDPPALLSPDAPWEPVDVTVPDRYEPDHVLGDTLDEVPPPPELLQPSPPWSPTDVPVAPDGPPDEPFDVAIQPSPAPREPVDVPITPDGPPEEPFDVAVSPDPAPWEPQDVETAEPHAPVEPFDVPVVPSAPPAAPFDVPVVRVRDHRDEPGSQPVPKLSVPKPPKRPTIESTIAEIGILDRQVADLLNEIGGFEPVSARGPGSAALDPLVLIRWFRDYERAVGKVGVAEFITQQTILYAKNPRVARVFNPLYFINMMVPGGMGNFTTAADAQFTTAEEIIRLEDSAKSQLPTSIPGEDLNPHSLERFYEEGQTKDIGTMVTDSIVGVDGSTMRRTSEAGVKLERFDATKHFLDGDGGQRTAFRKEIISGKRSNVKADPLARSAGTNGIVPAAFPRELEDGTFETDTDEPSTDIHGLSDDDAYIPVCFTDLRPTRQGKFRSVFVRPFNLQFSESIGPEFEEEVAFGRTDPAVGYIRTTRSFDVSFEMHAFAPEDLRVMHRKCMWLKSLAYPSYSADALLQSGPVCRMRIGDVVSSGRKGLPGVIRSLSFDHADSLWELQQGSKVTRSIQVSLSFLCLHEGPVGFLDGEFGELDLPSLGENRTRPIGVVRGHFQGFGEPRRK